MGEGPRGGGEEGRALKRALVALALVACKASPSGDALTETYTTANRAMVIHHPAGFAVTPAGERVAVVSPAVGSPLDPAIEIHFGTNDHPATTELDAYASLLHKPFREAHPDFVEEKRQVGACFKDLRGIETVSTFTGSRGKKLRMRSCALFASGRGYWMAYMAPADGFAMNESLLRSIVDATELRP